MRSKLSPIALGFILWILSIGTIAGASLDLPRVSFIDVGQGDSTVIQSNGIDEHDDDGHFPACPTIVTYLKNAGSDSLEVMVATHADTDGATPGPPEHIGGGVEVLKDESISVGQLLYNGRIDDINAFIQMINATNARGIPPVVDERVL